MLHLIDVSMEKLKTMSLRSRLLYKMLSEMIEFHFASGAIGTIVKRNPNYNSNPDDKRRVDEMLKLEEASLNAYDALHDIYVSEFGEMNEEAKRIMTDEAKSLANDVLKDYGWKKTERSIA